MCENHHRFESGMCVSENTAISISSRDMNNDAFVQVISVGKIVDDGNLF
jgi:hypothetical protein